MDNPLKYRTTQETEELIASLSAYMRRSLAGQAQRPLWEEEPILPLMLELLADNRVFWTFLFQHQEKPTFDSLEAIHRAAGRQAAGLAILCDTLRRQHQGKKTAA